jgi:hypothetical protein
MGKIRSISENGPRNASYDLRQLFLTWFMRSVDRFQGVPELEWENITVLFLLNSN